MEAEKSHGLKKAYEKEGHKQKERWQANPLASRDKEDDYASRALFTLQRKTGGLTVCVTCAGAGTAKPSNQKNEKV